MFLCWSIQCDLLKGETKSLDHITEEMLKEVKQVCTKKINVSLFFIFAGSMRLTVDFLFQIFIPFVLHGHWSLVVISDKIYILDSLSGVHGHCSGF
jgi:hypothetical protein